MTEEIIIDCAFYKDGVCASPINKTCEYCKNIDVSKCYHKQLKRLEQENKDLKKQIESQKGLITVGGKQQYDMTTAYDKCKTALEEIREIVIRAFAKQRPYKEDFTEIETIINEVLNDCK